MAYNSTAMLAIGDESTEKAKKKAGEAAHRRLSAFEENTQLKDNSKATSVEKIRWEDLDVRQLIGLGCFACVYKVNVLAGGGAVRSSKVLDSCCSTKKKKNSKRSKEEEGKGRSSPVLEEDEQNQQLGGTGTATTPSKLSQEKSYALKCLRPNLLVNNEETFVLGASDLALESKILSSICHPNIIKLHAEMSESVSKAFTQGGYFLVLDLLVEILDERLKEWRNSVSCSLFRPFASSSRETQQAQLVYRLEDVALAVCRAMEYLHKRHIILRDLKPSNIGFDEFGTLKIFDLGFAREMDPRLLRQWSTDDKYYRRCVTGVAGSPRYMANEVTAGKPCTAASDVYSFGILLWELYTLKKPFSWVKTMSQFKEKVAKGTLRPLSCHSISSPRITSLLTSCWDPSPDARPSCSQVRNILEKEIEEEKNSTTASGVAPRNSYYNLSRRCRKSSTTFSPSSKQICSDVQTPTLNLPQVSRSSWTHSFGWSNRRKKKRKLPRHQRSFRRQEVDLCKNQEVELLEETKDCRNELWRLNRKKFGQQEAQSP